MKRFDGNCLVNARSVERRTELFNRLVLPYQNMIFKLCIQYSVDSSYVEDNYNEVLANFFRYIETYDPGRDIRTWLHIVTKRYVFDADRKRGYLKRNDDLPIEAFRDTAEDVQECMGIDNYEGVYGDDVLWALKQLKPIYRDAILLQQAGYKLNEIVDIEFDKGSLDSKNIETLKSRLFLGRQQLQKLIDRNGKRRV